MGLFVPFFAGCFLCGRKDTVQKETKTFSNDPKMRKQKTSEGSENLEPGYSIGDAAAFRFPFLGNLSGVLTFRSITEENRIGQSKDRRNQITGKITLKTVFPGLRALGILSSPPIRRARCQSKSPRGNSANHLARIVPILISGSDTR